MPAATAPRADRRIALVLGGGGMKGFAHIGVLRALEEAKIVPDMFAGTSIGAMIAASYLSGTTVDELEERANALRRRDVFRVNHFGVLLDRMAARSIYLDEPLRELCEKAIPDVKFSDLGKLMLVNTVDVDHGSRVVWGLPGLDDVSVRDAVYASCALPGFFPPGEVDGRTCIDGGVVDNLPVSIAANFADLIIAVDVGSSDSSKKGSADGLGFAATYMRAATMMMHALQQFPLERWQGPPMILIRPKVDDENWLSFASTEANIAEGYRAAKIALKRMESYFGNPGCVYPRRRVRLEVDQEKCVGCQLCVSLVPSILRMNYVGKAEPIKEIVDWSPAEGGFVHECPTMAITAENIDRRAESKQSEDSNDPSPSGDGG